MRKKQIWRGLDRAAADALNQRDYAEVSLRERLQTVGVDAGEILTAGDTELTRIPGVELFPRTIHSQRHRGFFGELGREHEGLFGKLRFWPQQWSAARMFANTAKGFHVHPPFVPEAEDPEDWMLRRFRDKQNEPIAYELEQWDVMYFVQGRLEIILRDLRVGLPRITMRFFIDGDNHRSANNVGIVIPPGVAHALRVEGSEDVVMVYGTSTTFRPEFEGRVASEVESAEIPETWRRLLSGK